MISFPPVRSGDDIVISATTYVAFLKCPEQAAGRLRGEYGPETRRSFTGGLGHRIFARHLRDGPIPAAEFEQACREEIGAGMNPKMVALSMRPPALRDVIAEVGALYQRFASMRHEGFAGAEVQFEAEPMPGVTLRGGIDAIFDDAGGVRLVDWKTGSIPDTAYQQLMFYSLLWLLDRGELPVRVEAVSVASGETVAAEPTAGEVQNTADQLGTMVDTVRDGWESGRSLLRVGGPWCGYCPLLEDCSEGRAAAAVGSGRIAGRA